MSDLEHYARVAESIIETSMGFDRLHAPALRDDDPESTEGDIRERIYYHAAELGKSMMEMYLWLDQANHRKRATSVRPVGNQRDPLERGVTDRPVRAPSAPNRHPSGRKRLPLSRDSVPHPKR
jgi:hypothetical protein